MKALRSPRLWLMVWGGLGALGLVYVIIAASVQTSPRAEPSALRLDASLLTGPMAKFDYAFPARGAPQVPFRAGEKDVTLSDFKGKAVLVNFWATWCAPCVKELPSLDKLQAELGGDDFEVVAIAADASGPEKAKEFLDRHGIRNLALYSDARLRLVSEVSTVGALPLSILYDRNGKEIGRLLGEADWASPEARRLIESVIEGAQ